MECHLLIFTTRDELGSSDRPSEDIFAAGALVRGISCVAAESSVDCLFLLRNK